MVNYVLFWNFLGEWRVLLEECLSNELLDLRNKAAQAIGPLFDKYYAPKSPDSNTIINTYVQKLSSNHMLERIGYSLALGSLPPSFLNEFFQSIIMGLIDCTRITRMTTKWAESRRDAVVAMTKIWTKLVYSQCMLFFCFYILIMWFVLNFISQITLCCSSSIFNCNASNQY